ncbi:MAG: GNAT family N-acetyltransferase [Acidobacteriota bacterium]|nr:GNAT family N-acetyltransferase [Acidobacteriota bacterium]
MKSENISKNENDSAKIKILDFGGEYIDEVLEIQTECDLSIWSKNDYLDEIEKAGSILKIAQTAEQKTIGFALVRLLIDPNAQNAESRTDLPTEFDSSEILNIAVRQAFQHRGIGQMIFDEIVGELESKNIPEIWLEVRESNANALNFYRKNNFKIQFERKNYYTNPTENAYVLRRLINR